MGRVYEALDLELRRPVAIKVLRRELNDEDARARFVREDGPAPRSDIRTRVSSTKSGNTKASRFS